MRTAASAKSFGNTSSGRSAYDLPADIGLAQRGSGGMDP
jgi:hypothetical protein